MKKKITITYSFVPEDIRKPHTLSDYEREILDEDAQDEIIPCWIEGKTSGKIRGHVNMNNYLGTWEMKIENIN